MSTAAGEDILGWLDRAIATSQKSADRPWRPTHDAAWLSRRCAADRTLLKLHGRTMHSCPAEDETGYLDEWTQFGYDDVCPVVQHLAEGYGWTGGKR